MNLQTPPLDVGEIGCVAPIHAQERTWSTYPTRFSKQFQRRCSRKLGHSQKLEKARVAFSQSPATPPCTYDDGPWSLD